MRLADTSVPLRRLATSPPTEPESAPWSARRLNALHAAVPGLDRYLEIGIDRGVTLESVHFAQRVGVDPHPQFDTAHLPDGVSVHSTTSNRYFRSLQIAVQFDVIFVDGLHTYRQTYHDVIHALEHCQRGVVLIDDVVPSDEISAIPDQRASLAERSRRGLTDLSWHGDVYKVVKIVHDHHPELDWLTIVDRGNPQTFVWARVAGTHSTPVNRRILRSYARLSYGDVFAKGIPDWFWPAEESTGLTQVIDALVARRSGAKSPPTHPDLD